MNKSKNNIKNNQETIASNISNYRKARGLSQEELGQRIDRSLGWVNKLEKCKGITPTDSILDKIAYALGIPTSWLYEKNFHEDLENNPLFNPIVRIRISEDITRIKETLDDIKPLTAKQRLVLKAALEYSELSQH